MATTTVPKSANAAPTGTVRRHEAQHLQTIEGNALDADDIAMFEMFERERWSHERCVAYILDRARKAAAQHAAE